MKKVKSLVKKDQPIEAVVDKLFARRTPKEFIKTRPGPNGKVLKYVEIGFVVSELNKAFGPFWEWKVIDKEVGEDHVWVQGELTIKTKDGFSVSKNGFGGAAVKRSIRNNSIISIGNDLKAADSDALKKAASRFGIAADVFYSEMDKYEQTPDLIDVEAGEKESMKRIVTNAFFGVAAQRGFSPIEAKHLIKSHFKIEHMEDLTIEQLELAVKGLEKKYRIVEPGEKPSKIVIAELAEEPTEEEKEQAKENVNLDDIPL